MSRTTTKIIIARQDGSVLGQYVLGVGEHVIGGGSINVPILKMLYISLRAEHAF